MQQAAGTRPMFTTIYNGFIMGFILITVCARGTLLLHEEEVHGSRTHRHGSAHSTLTTSAVSVPVLRRARRGTGEAARLISRVISPGGGASAAAAAAAAAAASASASSESGRHVKSKGRKRTLGGGPLVAARLALRYASRHARCSPSRYGATACAHSSGEPDALKSRAYLVRV